MPMLHASMEAISDFLQQKRIAMVGVSRQPNDFSSNLFEELCWRGYDVVPVNPSATEIHGHPCFANVRGIQPPVDGALLMTSPTVTETAVRDCAEAGITRVWMYRGTGQGAVSPRAIAFCLDHGIQVVPGECPFMFLPNAGVVHRIHGTIRKLTGHYPGHAHVPVESLA